MKLLPSLLPAAVTLIATSLTASAAISINSWVGAAGPAILSGQSSTGLNWGNNTPNNADASFLFATIDGDTSLGGNQVVTLAIGDTFNFSGTAQFSGLTNTVGTVQFRFGLFDTNGSANTAGWNGYFVGNATSSGSGRLYERNGVGQYIVTADAIELATLPSTNGGVANAAANLTDGSYDFSLTLTRSASGLQLSSSLIRQTDGLNFASLTNFSESPNTPATLNYNRIGFHVGDGLDADQVVLSNVALTVVPEPSAAWLVLAVTGLGAFRRKRA